MLKLYSAPLRWLLLGLCFTVGGCILTNWWPDIYRSIVSKIVELKPGNLNYEMWKSPPVPISMNFYFFNWTNPEDFLVEGTKPHFVEIGPYSFKQTREKRDVVWNPNYTLSFKHERVWYFDEATSVGSIDDNITTLNVVALSAAYVTRHWNYFMLLPLSQVLKSQPLHVTHTVSEFLFEGYSDTLILMAQLANFMSVMDKPPLEKFAWFFKRNGSEDYEGVYNMRTGEDDIAHVAELVQWEYSNRTRSYSGECSELKGSMGERVRPGLKRTEPLTLFSKEICRSMQLEYSADREIEGVPGYLYEATALTLDNGTMDPSNQCYCGGACVPSGVMNISSCQMGSPSFMSLPHFHLADPSYLNAVEGLQPDPDKHSFYAAFEPTTGLPLDGAGRLQANILVQPYRKLQPLQRLPTLFFPIMWLEEHAKVTPRLALYLKMTLLLSPVGLYLSVLLAVAGVSLVTAAAAKYYQVRSKTPTAFIRRGDAEIQPTALMRPMKMFSPTELNLPAKGVDSSAKLLTS